MRIVEFPFEAFVNLEKEPYFVGRIVVNSHGDSFSAEIDIVNKESKKIYHHVGNLYNFTEASEALENAYQHLSNFLGRDDNRTDY